MRYLIAETSWPMMALGHEITANGTLLTRTDRPEDLTHYIDHFETDLLILDAARLSEAGLSLAGLSRSHPRLPVALIADAPSAEQVAGWLEAGAATVIDVTTPPEEAVLMLQAVARRALGLARPQAIFGPLRVDLRARKAYVLSCPLKLGPKLYEVLEYMVLRPGQLVTRAALLSHIYGLEDEPDPRVFDVYICNLRACMEASAGAVDIETVRGAGFRFVADVEGIEIAA